MTPPLSRFRLYGRTVVHLPTGAESARLDREAIEGAGIPGRVLMENAGRGAASLLREVYPEAPVTVVVGRGKNGGDGVVLARTLHGWGVPVRILSVGRAGPGDPLLHGWPLPIEPFPGDPAAADRALSGARVVVDALLGTGLTGPPRGPEGAAIEAMNRVSAPVVALDLPSGVLAGSGEAPGAAVEAELTIAFGAPKLGALLLPGRALSGRLTAIEIGLPPPDPGGVAARLITPGWFDEARPRRPLVTHKNQEGRLLLVTGRSGMAGAAVLAARAALRAGAGFVRVASAPENRAILQEAVPEAVFVDLSEKGALERALDASDAVAVGPGMGTGDDAAGWLRRIVEHPGRAPLVLDADALTLLADEAIPDPVEGRGGSRVLLTPHPGEMARLLGRPLGDDRVGEASSESRRRGCALLLKGTPSMVASPDGRAVWISPTGSSELARAGMGDVLTGVAGAFLARGADATESAALALHATGWAALLSGRGEALLPSDVAERAGAAARGVGAGATELRSASLLLDLDPLR